MEKFYVVWYNSEGTEIGCQEFNTFEKAALSAIEQLKDERLTAMITVKGNRIDLRSPN